MTSCVETKSIPEPSDQDLCFFAKANQLIGTASGALEEAQQYIDSIDEPSLKKRAQDTYDRL